MINIENKLEEKTPLSKEQKVELTKYLLKEFPSSVAHKTLKILDTDQDKKVSRSEWRRGWADGLLTEFVNRETAKAEGDESKESWQEKAKKKADKADKAAKKGGKKK